MTFSTWFSVNAWNWIFWKVKKKIYTKIIFKETLTFSSLAKLMLSLLPADDYGPLNTLFVCLFFIVLCGKEKQNTTTLVGLLPPVVKHGTNGNYVLQVESLGLTLKSDFEWREASAKQLCLIEATVAGREETSRFIQSYKLETSKAGVYIKERCKKYSPPSGVG